MSARSKLVRMLPCHCCALEGIDGDSQCGRTEEHHCNEQELAGHKRVGDHASVPLGAWHHRGVTLPGVTRDEMTFRFGPSLALSQRMFRFTYGHDAQMVAITNDKLARLEPATA